MTADLGNLALYRPIDNVDRGWGVRLLDAGYATVRPHEAYPPQHHPAPYMFTWEKGRCLEDFHILFIGQGRGVLETAHGGTMRVEAGDAFFLFPGEWHRYRPDPETGWTERWCGFTGEYAAQVMRTFFSRAQPVVKGAPAESIRRRLRTMTTLFEKGSIADVPSLVGELVGLLTDLAPYAEAEGPARSQTITHACDTLAASFRTNVDLEELARSLGMGYSFFRREFKRQTGFSPHAYVLELRFNRAKYLLRETTQSIETVARESGFATLAYFSRLFQKRMGSSPRTWREAQGQTRNG